MSFYYVDPQGQTKGPLSIDALKPLYAGGQIKDTTYIWNGTTVAAWTALNKVPAVLKQLKPVTRAAPPPSQPGGAPKKTGQKRRRRRRRRRKSPFGGGGGNYYYIISIYCSSMHSTIEQVRKCVSYIQTY